MSLAALPSQKKCGRCQCIRHLQSHFTDEMNWANYGTHWVVDHHVPLASATDAQAIVSLCHYTNLRPLGKAENLRKGASMPAVSGEL